VSDDDTNGSNGAEPEIRLTTIEIDERRTQVEKLRFRGLGVAQIAKVMGLDPKMVSRDLVAVRDKNRANISEMEQNAYIGEALNVLSEVQQKAWEEYHSTPDAKRQNRLKALDLIRSIEKDKLNALLDTGVIEKKEDPKQIDHKHTLSLDWNDEMRDKVANALLEQSLKTPVLAPVIDATVVEAPAVEQEEEDQDGEVG